MHVINTSVGPLHPVYAPFQSSNLERCADVQPRAHLMPFSDLSCQAVHVAALTVRVRDRHRLIDIDIMDHRLHGVAQRVRSPGS